MNSKRSSHHGQHSVMSALAATAITAAAAGTVIFAVTSDKSVSKTITTTTTSTTTTTTTTTKTLVAKDQQQHHLQPNQLVESKHVHVSKVFEQSHGNPEDEHMKSYTLHSTEISQEHAIRKALTSHGSIKDPLMSGYTMSRPEIESNNSKQDHHHKRYHDLHHDQYRQGVPADELQERLNHIIQHPPLSHPAPLRHGKVSPLPVRLEMLHQNKNGESQRQLHSGHQHQHHHHQQGRSRSGSSSKPHQCVDVTSCINSCDSSDSLVVDRSYHTRSPARSRPRTPISRSRSPASSRPRTPQETTVEHSPSMLHDMSLERDRLLELEMAASRKNRLVSSELLRETQPLTQHHGKANLQHRE
ncbi:hypothetical protein BGZ49_006023 [Haplosporangium sp. Z 27]|nr:hypothetical protein BGZ49_006023 [Haplosporangium sp. Z 27]